MISFDFTGRHVLVNGGTGGIGSAVVRAFAASGADVSFVYHGAEETVDEAERLCDEVRTLGGAATAKEIDSSDWDAVHRTVDEYLEQRQRLDVLVNVAGITRDAMLWKLTAEAWKRVMEVNAGSYFNFIHAAAPHFRKVKKGRIVNITSINGMRGKIGQANYSASKGAVIALTKTAARELGASNVTVNAIAPGFIETAMTKDLPAEVIQRARDESVLGKAGMPEDVAAAVLFLSSDHAGHITGEVVRVDGGQYI